MKATIVFALVALLLISWTARSHDSDNPRTIDFTVSSLESSFPLAGVFEGQIYVYPKKIEITVNKTSLHLRDIVPYKGRTLLKSIKVGLVKRISEERNSWNIEKRSNGHSIDKTMKRGDKQELGKMTFSIKIEEQTDLTKHWILFEMESRAIDFEGGRNRPGFEYAHSARDIFSDKK